jgi:hypothetical protein
MERPMVVGGPRKDWPMSASTRAALMPLWQSRKIKYFARVLFPVSVAPRRRVIPFSVSKRFIKESHSVCTRTSIEFREKSKFDSMDIFGKLLIDDAPANLQRESCQGIEDYELKVSITTEISGGCRPSAGVICSVLFQILY